MNSKNKELIINNSVLLTKISIILVISLIPIMVFARRESLTYFETANWLNLQTYVDLFSNSKLSLLVCLVLLGLYGSFSNIKYWYYTNNWVINLILLLVFIAIITTAFSMFPIECIWGAPSRREGLIAWLCYAWLFITSFKLLEINKKISLYITIGFAFSAFVAASVGVLQSFGVDIYKSELFLKLIHQENLSEVAKIENYPIGYSSFSTFGNTNPAGCFAVMSWSFFTALMFAINKNLFSWLLLFFQTLLFAFLVATRSRSSWLAALLTFFIILFLTKKNLRKHYAKFILFIFLNIFAIFAIDFASLKLNGKISRLFDQFSSKKIDYKEYIPDDFKDIHMSSDTIKLYFTNMEMTIKMASDGFRFYNEHNKEVPYEFCGNLAKFPEGEFWGIVVRIATDSNIMKITRYKVVMYLKYSKDGFKLLDGNGKEHDIKPANKWFIENDKWGNGRGYIWARSFPIMWRSIIFGYGPDSFVHVFPNYDLVSKIKAGYGAGWLVDKPHNWYIHVGVTLGGIALGILIVLIFYFFYLAIKYLSFINYEYYYQSYYIACVSALFSYCVALIFNDSYIGNAIVFWILFGSGYALAFDKEFRDKELRDASVERKLNLPFE